MGAMVWGCMCRWVTFLVAERASRWPAHHSWHTESRHSDLCRSSASPGRAHGGDARDTPQGNFAISSCGRQTKTRTEPWSVQKPALCAGNTEAGSERQMRREAHGQTHSNQSEAAHTPRLSRNRERRETAPHPNEEKCIPLTGLQTKKKKKRYPDPPFCSNWKIYKRSCRPSYTLKERVCVCVSVIECNVSL